MSEQKRLTDKGWRVADTKRKKSKTTAESATIIKPMSCTDTETIVKMWQTGSEQHYIEAITCLGELLYQKDILLKQLDEETQKDLLDLMTPSPAKKARQKAISMLRRTVATLDRKLANTAVYLRTRIDGAVRAGHSFVLETLADCYNLDANERVILAFFVYLEIEHGMETPVAMTRFRLARLFANHCRREERIQARRFLMPEARLLSSGILRTLAASGRPNELFLNMQTMTALCRMMGGDEFDKEWITPRKAQPEEKPITGGADTEAKISFGDLREPRVSLAQVYLPERDKDAVSMFLAAYSNPRLRRLGLGNELHDAQGMTFLLYGPPGTGKSMLAEAIAFELQRPIFTFALGDAVDKYVGETEKRIAYMFHEARQRNAVLLIDEADSFLQSRYDARQGWEIRGVNAMLCELQNSAGVVVLTTNMADCIDQAVERRLTYKLELRHPDASARAEIWRRTIPESVIADGVINILALARRYDFTGGTIKNAVMNALRHMVLDNREVLTMADLMYGANLERDGQFIKQAAPRHIAGFARQATEA